MAKVELNIVALGDFASVSTQIKNLQTQIVALQKNLAGVGVSPTLAKDLATINSSFKQTMLSTGQFTQSTVAMSSETERFGQALVNGKLKLSDYYNIIKQRSSEAVTQMKSLALEQTKLQNSLIINDPTKQGILNVYTPTQIDKVANATKIAANEANLYAIAVNKGSQQLINFGKNTQWAGRQLTVGMSVPLMIFGQQATQTFKDVNDQIVRLQKVYGTGLTQPSQQALDAIKQQTLALGKELASSMGISVKDTASMAADLAATGKTGTDLIVATREAMRLSKLGEMDTQQALQTTISLQNVYKLNTNELSGAINFLNAVENQTSTSLQDLAAGIPKVGPVIQQLGGSFKDTAVMMVAMKEAGVPAAQSANAIKSAIASLINPTKGAEAAFAKFHINLKDIATSTGGNPVKMIMELQQALKGIAPLAQAQLIEKLFGKFQEARIQALITNLGAANSQTKTAFDLMNANSAQLASVAAGEMKTATESVTGKYQRAIQTFKADLIPVGQELLKIATKLLDFGNSVAKVFSGLPGPLKTVMGAIAIGVALSGPVIMLTGLLANFAGFVMRGVFNLKQLATGGKTLGQLLTPELIAAQNASQIFNSDILTSVGSVELLNKAIGTLTASIESMVSSMNVGTGLSSVLGAVETIATKGKGSYTQMSLPGFATGGIVRGPGTGTSDSIIARISNGESIIDAETTKKYPNLIQALITGRLPKFAKGQYKVNGQEVTIESAHAMPEHNADVLAQARDSMELQNSARGVPQLDAINAVTKGLLIPTSRAVNQATKSDAQGMTGEEVAAEMRKAIASGVDPMGQVKDVLKRMGGDLEKDAPKLDSAMMSLIKELETTQKNVRFGSNPNMNINTGESNGGSLESFMDSQLSPALSGVSAVGTSGRRRSLREVFSSVVGTRGPGRGRSGALSSTGKTLVLNDNGKISAFNESDIKREFPDLSAKAFSTSGSSNLPGVISSKKNAEDVGITTGEAVTSGFKTGTGSHSPSIKAEQTMFDFGKGVELGGAKIVPEVEKVGTQVGETISKTTAEAITASTPEVSQAMAAQTEEAANVAQSRMSIIASKLKGKAALGGGMGAMMAGQMLAGQGGILGAAGGAMSNAGMASMAMPGIAAGAEALGFATPGVGEVMATVAAMTLAYKGVNQIINGEKAAQAQAAATFSSSSEMATFFGGVLQDTSSHLNQISTSYDAITSSARQAASTMGVSNTQIASFVNMTKSLPKDNPLTVIMDKLKGTSGSAAGQFAKAFIDMQIAIGNIDPAKAQQALNLLLASSGNSNQIGSVSSASNQANAVTSAIKSAQKIGGGGSGILAHTFNDALGFIMGGPGGLISAEQRRAQGKQQNIDKATSSAISDSLNAAINSKSLDRIQQVVQGINAANLGAARSFNIFRDSLASAADQRKVEILQSYGLNLNQIAKILSYLQAGNSIDLTKGLGGIDFKKIDEFLKNWKDPSLTSPQIQAAQAVGTSVQAQLDSNKAQIKALEAKKKIIDAELKAQRDISTEMQRQHDYAVAQVDLQNKATDALIHGDYLTAATLNQEKSYGAMQFNQQTKAVGLQGQSDLLAQKIADLNDKQTTLTDAINNNSNKVQDLTNKLAANPPAPVPQGQLITPMIGLHGANTTPSMANAYVKAAAAGDKGLKPMPGEIGVDPSKWNTPNLGISGFSSREAIKQYAKDMKYGLDSKGKYDETKSLFEIDHNNIQYMFKRLKDGNVQMEGQGKVGQVYDPKTGKFVSPSVNIPTPSVKSSVSSPLAAGTTISAASGSVVQNWTVTFSGNVGDPAQQDAFIKKMKAELALGQAKVNTTNKVVKP